MKLYSAAREGRYDVVVECIAQGADPSWRSGAGETGLHLAAWRGHVRVARLLLDSGWELEVAGSGGYQGTPLHCAASRGRVAVISLLVERGADTDCRDPQLETPLHWAAQRGKRAAVRRLLRLGADINIETFNHPGLGVYHMHLKVCTFDNVLDSRGITRGFP